MGPKLPASECCVGHGLGFEISALEGGLKVDASGDMGKVSVGWGAGSTDLNLPASNVFACATAAGTESSLLRNFIS